MSIALKEMILKRTRRIEVIRYTRKFTVTEGDSAAGDMAAEREPRDLILDVLAGIPPASEQEDFDASASGDEPTEHPSRCPSLVRLGHLLRLRGRT